MRENSKVLSYCFILHFLHGSSIGRSDSCGSSSSEGRSSPPKGPFVLCPFRGGEYCGVGTPSVSIYTNSLAPTSWKDSRSCDNRNNLRRGKVYNREMVTMFLMSLPSGEEDATDESIQ
jgi:hypothetical protein